jgi:hypothetical protein
VSILDRLIGPETRQTLPQPVASLIEAAGNQLDRLTAVFRRTELKPQQGSPFLDDLQQIQARLPLFDWGPFELRSMLQHFYDGIFSEAEEFYENIRRDGRMYDGLRRRGNALTRYPQLWKLPKNAPPEVKVAARKLRRSWVNDCLTKRDLAEIDRRLAFFGVCLVQRSYRLRHGTMVPKLTPWTMRNVVWDAARQLFIVPRLDGMPKEVPLTGDQEFLVITAGGTRPWIDGACIPLARVFLLISQGWDKWAQYNDVQALAIRVLKTPMYSREQLESGEAARYVRLLKSGDTWLNPQGQGGNPGYELSLLESKHANGYEGFMKFLEHLWTIIAIIWLGHNLSQEVRGASLAATKEGMGVTRELSEADANLICNGLAPLWPEWVLANFSEKTRASWPEPAESYAPSWHIDAEEKEDQEQQSKIDLNRANAVKTFVEGAKSAGIKMKTLGVDWRGTAQACGMVMLPLKPGQAPPAVEFEDPPPAAPALPPGKPMPRQLMHGRLRRPLLLLSAREPETEGER